METSFFLLTNDLIVETYLMAIEYQLDEAFIKLIESEIIRRNLLIDSI
ncbi:sporulation histidine kinase inhibitor Sda [Bacillus sp. FJAT-45350]|nr:sporulation histidine kinase inhibitor Sda [Bacillus sp. FJAT-45350]